MTVAAPASAIRLVLVANHAHGGYRVQMTGAKSL
jgi:hypothetical protein